MLNNSLLYNLRIAPTERICYTHLGLGMRIAYPVMKRIRLLLQQLFNTFHFFTLNGTTSLTCQIKETKKLTFIRCIIPTAKSQPLLVIAVSITGRFIAYFKRLRDAFGIIQLQLMD